MNYFAMEDYQTTINLQADTTSTVPASSTSSVLRMLHFNSSSNNDGHVIEHSHSPTFLVAIYVFIMIICVITPTIYCIQLWRRQQQQTKYVVRIVGTGTGCKTPSTQNSHGVGLCIKRESDKTNLRKHSKLEDQRRARLRILTLPVREVLKAHHFTGSFTSPNYAIDRNETFGFNGSIINSVDVKTNLTIGEENYNKRFDPAMADTCDKESSNVPLIRIPQPGLSTRPPGALQQTRLVPAICNICLSTYCLGSDVVWSSNPLCKHVFHLACIEPWLLKHYRGPPICPCCRKDFIVDALATPPDDESVISNDADATKSSQSLINMNVNLQKQECVITHH